MKAGEALDLQTWRNLPLDKVRLPGMGPRTLEKLKEAGILTVMDLLGLAPKDYLDYSEVMKIGDAPLNKPVLIQGDIIACEFSITPKKRLPILEILVDDGYGALRAVWFNQAYLKDKVKKGMSISLRGKIRIEKMGRTMNSPKFSILEESPTSSEANQPHGIEPVYRQIGGIKSHKIAGWIQALLEQMPGEDGLPESVKNEGGFPDGKQALATLHRPPDAKTVRAIRQRKDPALSRLIFEEFFAYQKQLRKIVAENQRRPHVRINPQEAWGAEMWAQLPFCPTDDQSAILESLIGNLKAGGRLYAMIQGDVGCGKTVIAIMMAHIFCRAGLQVALLCPTTVLANQHFEEARKWMEPLGHRVLLMTSQESDSQLKKALAMAASGEANLVVGTHRLFQKDVVFKNLCLAMIDEQHRFGVDQRRALLKKAEAVHYLAFSATPIPRSLAMTLYGDYQVLQIRQKPENRIPVKTILKKTANREQVIQFARSRIALGESVFWVFPLIEGEEEKQEKSASHMFESFKQSEFSGFKPGLVHGKMAKEDIQKEMALFRAGDIQVLVATTVIEVGVDVPHASIMVVENANHFGLSQLHQLRGRVGRGDKPSYCFLLIDEDRARDGLERMRFLEKNNDGFAIAEFDMKQRGAGQLLGKKQSGEAGFRFGDPYLDRALMEKARDLSLTQIN